MAPTETYRPAFPPSEKPSISYGLPFEVACAQHITSIFNSSRVYIIVSNSISKTDAFTRLEKTLEGKVVGVRKGIRPHTPYDDVLEVVRQVREVEADLIVTLGAGSLTDGAKVVAFATANNASSISDLSDLTTDALSKSHTTPQAATIPVISIPTSLSGGEYASFAGATDTSNGHKTMFSHPSMGISLIILDPALSVSTPERVWLSSGVRAIDHCVEGLCSVALRDDSNNTREHRDEIDASFEKGLKLLVNGLLKTKGEGNWEKETPRMDCMLGVLEATRGVRGVEMGASHGIGHQLGPMGVGHGETSCVMLPAVLKYNFKHGEQGVRDRQKTVLDVLWGMDTVVRVAKERGVEKGNADAGDVVGMVVEALGLPRTLMGVGVGRERLDELAGNSLKDPWLKTNPVPLTEKSQVLEVLEMVVGG